MSRARKLSPEQVAAAAVDRRSGLSWQKLSRKYQCAVNTLRNALAEYSDEFHPIRPVQKSELERQLNTVQSDVDNIKKALRKRFNLHVP